MSYEGQLRRACSKLVLLSIGIALAASVAVAWCRPKVFWLHTKVFCSDGAVGGEVFKSSSGVCLVRLNSGTQLSVTLNPAQAFLSSKSSPFAIRLGNMLIVPAKSIGGVDLGKCEGFERQVPLLVTGKIQLKDPIRPSGSFWFPIED